MEIDEVAARIVRGYWMLLLGMLVVPLVVTAVVVGRQDPQHTATARLQASGRAADAAAGDAGVSMVVSQVKAFATSRPLLERVLAEQRVARTPDAVAKRVSASGLGASTVVELSVSDTDPRVARRLTDALGRAVVDEINQSNRGAITAEIADVERRMRDLQQRLGPLSRRAAATPPDIDAANERERVQAELSDLRTTRTELRAQLSAAGAASLVQPAVLEPRSDPAVMMSAVAGLTGLVAGVLVAVAVEIFRPTVPGQRRVARRLGVPLLGWADRGPAALADLGRRTRLSARRQLVRRVVLVTTGSRPLPADLVSAVAAAVSGDRAGTAAAAPNGRVAGDGSGAPSGADDREEGPGAAAAAPVARGGTALKSKPAATTAPSEAALPGPSPDACRVHAFEDVDVGADERTGVIAVVGPLTPQSALESLRDLVDASGWPLLGVVAVSRASSLSRGTSRGTSQITAPDHRAPDHSKG